MIFIRSSYDQQHHHNSFRRGVREDEEGNYVNIQYFLHQTQVISMVVMVMISMMIITILVVVVVSMKITTKMMVMISMVIITAALMTMAISRALG